MFRLGNVLGQSVGRGAARRSSRVIARRGLASSSSRRFAGKSRLAAAVGFGVGGLWLLNEQNQAQCWGSKGSSASVPHHGVPGTNKERTFLAVKPDGVQRGIVGAVIQRFETRGYKLVGLKMVWPTKKMAEEHYADLSKKPFFAGLTDFFSSGPIVCMCWEGKDVIRQGRVMLGETDPLKSPAGSIRGMYSIDLGRNILHGSDSPESAQHELTMWFKKDEINNYDKTVDVHIYEPGR